MKKIYIGFLFVLAIIYAQGQGQSYNLGKRSKIDSLLRLVKAGNDDTAKVNRMNLLATGFRLAGKSDTDIIICSSEATLAQKLGYNKGLGLAWDNLGHEYENTGDVEKALDYLNRALKVFEGIKDTDGMAKSISHIGLVYQDKSDNAKALTYLINAGNLFERAGDKYGAESCTGNIGIVYYEEGDYPKALDYFFKALKLIQSTGNRDETATAYLNIGLVYDAQADYKQALSYDNKALDIFKDLKHNKAIAIAMRSIGDIYNEEGNSLQALDNYLKAEKLNEATNDKNEIATSHRKIGMIYKQLGDYAKAVDYNTRAFDISKETGNVEGCAASLLNIGEVYLTQKKFADAGEHFKEALVMADSIHNKECIRDIEKGLSTLYNETGQWQKAYDAFKAYTDIKDSLVNEDKSKQIGKLEAKSDFDKQLIVQQAEDDKKSALAAADSKRQKITIVFVGAIALAIAIIAVVILRSLRVTRKQKTLIENQKQVVEEQKLMVEQQKAIVDEKNKDITDSIHYASRIQRALLTTEDYIGKRLKDYFILFKPRDIVSGDFYWANEVETNSGKQFLICAGDCTGHGVPGAFMSLLNISTLNEVNIEKKINGPAKILDEVREHIIKALNPEGKDEGSKDGMDCILVSLHSTKGGATLNYAAAYNTPLVIKKGSPSEGGEAVVIDLPADKMPVGIFTGEKKLFTERSVELQSGDCVYLFTDGYADQFGGPKGKKFKYKQLSDKLKAISEKPMAEQKQMLEKTFEDWKSDLEQIDDVLVIGIRI